MLTIAPLPYRAKRTTRAAMLGSQPAGHTGRPKQRHGSKSGSQAHLNAPIRRLRPGLQSAEKTRGNAGSDPISGGSTTMLALLVLLILLFLIFGGLGLFVAKWLLIICLIALVLALVTGGGYYRRL